MSLVAANISEQPQEAAAKEAGDAENAFTNASNR
jgi:hypothetical protein